MKATTRFAHNYQFLMLAICLINTAAIASDVASKPPEISIGERLFLETRFVESFFANSDDDPNTILSTIDPVARFDRSMNCKTCHWVNLQLDFPGMRSYPDFAQRAPIPTREEDDFTVTVRNSPTLVNAVLPRQRGLLLHSDGEFPTIPELVKKTLTGRNYGWLPDETATATAHVANVIRHDDGQGTLAQIFGGAYATVFNGNGASPAFHLPKAFRLNVMTATNVEILNAVAKLIGAYVENLTFAQDENGLFNGSPYDLFLRKNALPATPRIGESIKRYTKRLRAVVNELQTPHFVDHTDGKFVVHDQAFVFGPTELEGLKIFLRSDAKHPRSDGADEGIGNCAACHQAPNFTDFGFHNTGVTQKEYDDVHGEGAFEWLRIPDLRKRDSDYDAYLPATAQHPDATGPFRSIPRLDDPQFADLGVWNMLFNPDFAASQERIFIALCTQQRLHSCHRNILLRKSVATFKTPSLRDLGRSAPYTHTGLEDTLEDVVRFYVDYSQLARTGNVRNASPELRKIRLSDTDVNALTAFLRSLNEGYE